MASSLPTVTDQNRPYRPYGGALAAWESHAPVVLLAGPAGTGKTRANLEKLFFCAEHRYPGMRGLILRKTRKSLSETALVTFENFVVPAGHEILRGPQRTQRSVYRFGNGSTIAIAGYDDPEKLFSSEYDLIYIPEASELTEDEVEKLFRALRWTRMPYKQILMDCNPQGPNHWLKRWANTGRLQFLDTTHRDNPAYWDHWAQRWTPEGERYLALLDQLTGVRYQRLRLGKWVQAEGQVYDGWNPAVHLVTPFAVPAEWPRYLSIDFGYTNPFVCQWWAEDGDGRLYLYREIYHTGRLVEDHARAILQASAPDPFQKSGGPAWRAIVCDHDAEDRATLERHLRRGTTAAIKEVSPGVQSVAARLRVQPDGRPRVFIFRDALVDRDGSLAEAKRPVCTAEEVESYVWDETRDQRKEVPVKENDHGCDAMRYLVHWRDQRAGAAAASKLSQTGGLNVVQGMEAGKAGKAPVSESRRASDAGSVTSRPW